MKHRTSAFRLTPSQILALGYVALILCGGLLLSLPVSSAAGESTSFLDALFTATSAVCVTGLVVLDTANHFSVFGHAVILLLIQVGGIGFTTVATLFALMFRRRISLRDRMVLQQSMNQMSMEGIVRLVRKVIFYSLAIEAAGTALLTARFAADMAFGRALWFGAFHAVSIFNNAGFDLFGGFRSLTGYVGDPVVNLVSMALIVTGGIGFIVLSDLVELRRTRRLSLHSKVVLSFSAGLIVIGAIIIFIFELTNPKTLGALDPGGKVFASLFQSVTPRSGGVVTLDIASMRQATQFFLILLMFVGAAPGSTGGGIKVTTFAILAGAMMSMLRGRRDIVLFRYRLAQDRIYKAVTFILLSLLLVVFVTMALSTIEDASFLAILFETVSAFGTVGASMGLTPHLTAAGKILIMATMFVGRLGPLTLAVALRPNPGDKELYRHPEGKIIIG